MSHKVHPKIFRVKGTADWLSHGFYGEAPKKYLQEDFIIRNFLTKKLKDASVEKIEIERYSNKIIVLIYSARPGIIIGRGGEGVEKLRAQLLKEIFKKDKLSLKELNDLNKRLKIEIKEVPNPWVSAELVAQWIAQKIEKRTPFRKTIKQAIEKVMANKAVQGIKVGVSGRLDGVQIARSEWLEKGRLPRQTIRADIDYALEEARCTYGTIGIKVWIYKGDKFD
ncbi:MAG TPA: 30S ribosomal protein S3 [Candidatus Pacearchaeota archaeon]|jgi:small subunit ribosomal protein S3|nr:30S ribosomal protein S3 [Candidatus Pacearchaeota archaeon]HRR94532.1 30S ribosomal protein S3 [Candidatus Paceibacterota bacterium]HPC30397.1 30S ribosomal protein S3 [Candidatus Pacearchaeota archaeon]HQG09109.1 30S ribosomal protein S3 [Candidatus Pacearchaeota archaeon]HQH20093.1 30S ribosomal protein S3 [Candidatus Pacearchaeota archaeon]